MNERHARYGLAGIGIVAAALRLYRPGHSPPGIHVDAAANAWNAACLLAAGTDWHGTAWPILFSRGFGENQSTLYYYALLPFQALLGISTWVSVLPSAVGGIAAVLLAYSVGARLFGRAAGLAAAALLAVAPWPLFLSRWGHESGLVPILSVLPLAAMLWAGLPIEDRPPSPPRPARAALAGLVGGVCCYGYYALRLFVPALVAATVLLTWRGWREALRSRRGAVAIALWAALWAATFGPLVIAHLTDPEVSKRGREFLLWRESDTATARVEKVASRYAAHFGPDFLFLRGDTWPLHSLPGSGPLPKAALPLVLAGLLAASREARSSRAARLLLAWVALYPLADSFTSHPSLHLLRSSPGLIGLVLLAALGAVRIVEWIGRRRRTLGLAAAGVIVAALVFECARFGAVFLGEYDRRPEVRRVFNADLLEASEWLRPRLAGLDAVVFSARDSAALGQPFIVTLVGFRYDAGRWLRDEREVRRRPDTDLVVRYGNVRFLFDDADVAAVRSLESAGRVALVVRPGEVTRTDPVHVVQAPDGSPEYLIFETGGPATRR